MLELILLEHWNFSPLLVLDVFINCEEKHEGKEETSPTKEVPDVVSEKGGHEAFQESYNLHIQQYPS